MKVGLTLSGGGIRGIAHLGVVKALYEAGIRFSTISGTSAGAIVGAFLANGYQPDYILNTFKRTNLFKYIKPTIKGFGLLSLQNTDALYRQFLPERFEDLEIPMTVVATDFGNNAVVYFKKGALIKPIQASSCIPAVFKPIEIDGKIYVDGGLIDNFPAECIRSDCDFLIGSCCNHLNKIEKVDGIKSIIERSVILTLNARSADKKHLCDVVIEPGGLGAISLFHIKKADFLFEEGYRAAKNALTTDKALISIAKAFKSPPYTD